MVVVFVAKIVSAQALYIVRGAFVRTFNSVQKKVSLWIRLFFGCAHTRRSPPAPAITTILNMNKMLTAVVRLFKFLLIFHIIKSQSHFFYCSILVFNENLPSFWHIYIFTLFTHSPLSISISISFSPSFFSVISVNLTHGLWSNLKHQKYLYKLKWTTE